jgi:glutamate synthase domain-containing protein 2/glutamate synthase domain-containing protein 1/glutamate synthase domain-containing protein 3
MTHYRNTPPEAQGLYDPQHEHDACGVGFIANLNGVKSHYVLSSGLKILENLQHRGACGCEDNTGDGAGVLLQVPDKFLRKVCAKDGLTLPPAGEYAVGMVFLPTESSERVWCEQEFAKVVAEEGQTVLGWRDVPRDNSQLGHTALAVEPAMRQIFVGPGSSLKGGTFDQAAFEWKLYVIRKRIETVVRGSQLTQKKFFYVPSLSTRTIVYKGLLLATQIERYYLDLIDEDMETAIAMVHQRYSTNTFPTWDLAHPFRYIAHNGEINTVRGNQNWMRARQLVMGSKQHTDDVKKLFPIIPDGMSDSAAFDCALELLHAAGRSLPHAVMMMIPAAWDGHESMPDELKAFYEYHACLMEPWDGPASLTFTDGTIIGATLDRNGLRPSRYTVTKDGFVIMASETGVLPVEPENVASKGRLQPGRMFLVDTAQGRLIPDEEIKQGLAARKPYRQWLTEQQIRMSDIGTAEKTPYDFDTLLTRQQAFGYTLEDVRIIMTPMGTNGEEPLGSMGNDTPLAVLSNQPQLLYSYFKQLFAQVTNPPLDAIREELVTSMAVTLGAEQDLFEETPEHAHQLFLKQPILTSSEMAALRDLNHGRLTSRTIETVFDPAKGGEALKAAMEDIRAKAQKAIEEGVAVLILSDRTVDKALAPIPALLACSGVHQHLIRQGTRTRCSIILETGEPREVHHFALLFGYGAGAINPYLAFETLSHLAEQGQLKSAKGPIDAATARKNYIKAINKGVLKVMSKMGISTIQSYQGAQIFEAVGLNRDFVKEYFTATASRVQGIGIDVVAEEMVRRHARAFPAVHVPEVLDLDVGGQYQWRRRGEYHMVNPEVVALLQHAVRSNNRKAYDKYASLCNDQAKNLATLRGLLEFKSNREPIPLDEVESAAKIVRRFATGAMSLGSISREAHETIAIAMNRMGGKSNTGEGGEDAVRFKPDANGDLRRSAIKQVASGRFGVTSEYLVNSDEIQIKMAQGAKPGEGGQLPGHKVDEYIGKIRHSTPGVGLISPPPHHDIYSIEDLAQLIHDLKNANKYARINVKLVSEVGVGTVAAGVSKGKADVVLISGYEGGTGASPLTSLKHCGIPWELGLAETHQTLVIHNLRSRIVVQTDGQLKTGRDIAVAILLGAEEFGFSTAALIAAGCIMMRVCHLNTCPVGIATQDPRLRAKFAGKPEHIVNFFQFIAEDLRQIMAQLGFKTVDEMVGHVECLDSKKAIDHWKAKGLDFGMLLYKPELPPGANIALHCTGTQDHGLDAALDNDLIAAALPALERKEKVVIAREIKNINRTVGTMLGSELTRRHGGAGLPDGTITVNFTGSAGQSVGAFLPKGITLTIEGDANDFVGKGLSGGRIAVFPSKKADFPAEENVIIGNVACYGATGGELFARGMAGERFCVRNSGVDTVVEGVGDHGCEYMTKGTVVVIGRTGRNFAAGMSGGFAYVLDERGDFAKNRCNKDMVDLEPLAEPADIELVKSLLAKHKQWTGSVKAEQVLTHWDAMQPKFVKVYPKDYRRVMEAQKKAAGSKEGALAGAGS